ncbi:hypothetical protein GCM10025859_37360 [Alicyclobacillus fastidiosus]|nr:hypothetical protein GCM10025859_37360 [Alicyclobacillus fastidiosus]
MQSTQGVFVLCGQIASKYVQRRTEGTIALPSAHRTAAELAHELATSLASFGRKKLNKLPRIGKNINT